MKPAILFVVFVLILYAMISFLIQEDVEPIVVRKTQLLTSVKKSPVAYPIYKTGKVWD